MQVKLRIVSLKWNSDPIPVCLLGHQVLVSPLCQVLSPCLLHQLFSVSQKFHQVPLLPSRSGFSWSLPGFSSGVWFSLSFPSFLIKAVHLHNFKVSFFHKAYNWKQLPLSPLLTSLNSCAPETTTSTFLSTFLNRCVLLHLVHPPRWALWPPVLWICCSWGLRHSHHPGIPFHHHTRD